MLSFDAFFDLCDYFGMTPEKFFTQYPQESARLRGIRQDLGRLSEKDLALVEELVSRRLEQ